MTFTCDTMQVTMPTIAYYLNCTIFNAIIQCSKNYTTYIVYRHQRYSSINMA